MLQESWNGENYGFVSTKHYFSWFLGVGFGDDGQLFSSGFPNWVRECNFMICCEIQGPTGTPHNHFWALFPLKNEGRFFDDF